MAAMTYETREKIAEWAIVSLTVISLVAIVAGIIIAYLGSEIGAVIAVVTGGVGGIVAIVLRENKASPP